MRPKGLIGLLVVVLIVAGLGYLLSDKFIERQLESIGESIVGAKVEIDNLNFSLVGLAISFDRLQVTNPNDTWKNMFETGRVSFDMEVAPLARKKVIINDVTIADIRIGTKRASDGKIERQADDTPGWVSEAAESLKQQVAAAPVLNLGILKQKVNVDSLLAAFDIQSLNKIGQARQDAAASFARWENTVAEFRPQNDFEKVKQQVQEITSQKVSSLKQLLATADKTKKVINTLDKLKKEIESLKKSASADLSGITRTFAQVDNWIKDDFDAVKSKANLADFSAQNIGKMLFGDVLVAPTIGILEYIGLGRKYMPVAKQLFASGKVEKPPRLKGQDIRFPLLNGKPNFLLEHVLISGATNQQDTSKVLRLSGEVKGITTEQKVYGKPLTFALNAALPNSNAYEISGEFDHTGDTPSDRFRLTGRGIRFGKIDLPEKPYLPSQLIADRGDITADFGLIGDELDFKVSFTGSPVTFGFAQGAADNNVIAKVTRSVFDSIDKLTLSARIHGPANAPRLSISSNIDDVLAARIKGVLGESVRLAQAEIEKKINAIVQPKKEEALAFVNQNKARLESEIDKIESAVTEQLDLLEQKKKEVEAEIAKKKGKGLKDVKDKLKGLFKKN